MRQLNRDNLGEITSVEKPSYNLDDVKIGVLHMGLGAFHRAHQGVFFDNALRAGKLGYAIASVSQRTPSVSNILSQQDGLYTVNSADQYGNVPRIIGSIREAAFFSSDERRLLHLAQSSDLRLITITASEKAYHQSLPSRLALLLHARYEVGLPGIAIISCDNLPSNGEFTKGVIDQAIADYSDGFKQWIKGHVRFPNSMVDRIVPAITPSSIEVFESRYGYRDESLITAEPFNQWVIEHDPLEEDLSETGIRFVDDIAPYELAKIRLFNGVHSTLAYLGQILDIKFAADVIIDPRTRKFLSDMQIKEISNSFNAPQDLDLVAYSAEIRGRMSNPALLHRTEQIAMDGSQKLPQRLFNTANDLLSRNLPTPRTCLAIALWIHYLAISTVIDDPMRTELKAAATTNNAYSAVAKCLTLDFATKINPALFPPIGRWLELLRINSPWHVLSILESENV